MVQVLELQGTELKVLSEAEKPSSFKCSTFGAASPKTRHLATGSYAGTPFSAYVELVNMQGWHVAEHCQCTSPGEVEVWDLERLDAPVFAASSGSKGVNGIDGCGGMVCCHGCARRLMLTVRVSCCCM